MSGVDLPTAGKILRHKAIERNFPTSGKTRILLQACESLADTRTRKREIVSLSESMAELGIKVGTIVTRSGYEQIRTDAGTIDVIPVWRFFLELPETA